MSRGSSESERVRAFFALKPNEQLGTILIRQLIGLKKTLPESSVRWVWPDNLHLTLRFLGSADLDSQLKPLVLRSFALATLIKPFTIRIGSPRLFPDAHRPVVIASEIESSGPLCKLVKRIESEVSGQGFPAETREFRPHLTLGRIKRGRGSRIRLEASDAPGVEWKVDDFVLMRSETKPEGAVYSEIARFPLDLT